MGHMRTISFDTLCRILNDCSAVIWGDEQMLTYPSFQYPEEGETRDFLHLEGENDKYEFEVDFYKEDNETVKVHGNRFFLKDGKGQEVEIRPLFSKDLSEYQ